MTDASETHESRGGGVTAAPARPGLSIGLYLTFALMVAIALVSVSYAVSMIGFLADDGYFIAYSSLCDTVPIVAALDQFVPFVLAAMWLGCIYLGATRDYRFVRATIVTALISVAYGAANVVLGPFTFRVGPADFDPASATCGRWPRDLTGRDLEMMQIDWLGTPISTFAVALIFGGMFVYVYLRVSKKVRAVYRRPKADPVAAAV